MFGKMKKRTRIIIMVVIIVLWDIMSRPLKQLSDWCPKLALCSLLLEPINLVELVVDGAVSQELYMAIVSQGDGEAKRQ
jgi:hypothetical protein